MEFVKSFFTKSPATLDELYASVMKNEKVPFDVKNNFHVQYNMWKLLISQADALLLNASTPIEKFTRTSLNGMTNANFTSLSTTFQTKAMNLSTEIPNVKRDLLAVLTKLNPQYPGIYEKMQQVMTDQSSGILDSLRSKRSILNNAKTRRNMRAAKSAANILQTRLQSFKPPPRTPQEIANNLQRRLQALKKGGKSRKQYKRQTRRH